MANEKTETRKCFCGCSYFKVIHSNQLFAPHHTTQERRILRRKLYKRLICQGMIEPSGWRICESCGDLFPWFKEIHGTSRKQHSCPEFINLDCAEDYRNTRRNEKKQHTHHSRNTNFRRKICTTSRGQCANYSKCSDRVYNSPPHNKWEYELHGENCFEEDTTRQSLIVSSFYADHKINI